MSAAATDLIFHNYAMSPFSEKIRKVFAHKGATYHSVDQPMWMPKPHLTPLTGGFRRIPVMQIGADVYCDTALIARKLEQLYPEPTLYPAGNVAAAEGIAAWADRQVFFGVCAPLVFGALAEVLPPELLEDRKKMRPDLDVDVLRGAAPDLRAALGAYLGWLESGLDGRAFLLGDAFSLADAAVYHCLWFVRNDPDSAAQIEACPRLSGWMARVAEMGDGTATTAEPEEALEVARTNEPASLTMGKTGTGAGLEPGTKVGICSDDLQSDVIEGEVLGADAQEIVIRRSDAQLGDVAVHFPRAGYLVRPAR